MRNASFFLIAVGLTLAGVTAHADDTAKAGEAESLTHDATVMNIDLQNKLVPARDDVIPRFTVAPIADNESDKRFTTDVGNPVDEKESPFSPRREELELSTGFGQIY